LRQIHHFPQHFVNAQTMKKILKLILSIVLITSLFLGCKADESEEANDKYNNQDNSPTVNVSDSSWGLLGTTITLNGSVVDPEGGNVTYQWSITSKPAGSSASLYNMSTLTPSITLDELGDFIITLTGRDYKFSNSDTITITSYDAVLDSNTELLWQKSTNKSPVEWKQDFCSSFALGGFSDWRIPTIDELEQVYPRISSLFIDFTFPVWSSTTCNYYSSSSDQHDRLTSAGEIDCHFDSLGDHSSTYYTYTPNCVRKVTDTTTGSTIDTTAPTVISTNPTDGSTDVFTNSTIAATFSEAMNSTTISTSSLTISNGTSDISGTVSYSDKTATFIPSSQLTSNTFYTASLSTGVKDIAGNRLISSYSWTFSTESIIDTTPPSISLTSPIDSSTDVTLDSHISATFDEKMNSSSITTDSFNISNGNNAISGNVSYSDKTSTFIPSSQLTSNTFYTASLSTNVEDLSNNAIENNYSWTFTTGPFLVLAKSVSSVMNFTRNITLSSHTNLPNLTYSIVSQPSHGSLLINGSTALYTPTSEYKGSDLFTYKANNGNENSSTENINITVNPPLFSDTGQTTSYTHTHGEDSDYSINPPSYTNNGDGTVTDNVTELVWQQPQGNSLQDWYASKNYCENLILGSKNDWRLPTVKELSGILDLGEHNPTISTVFSGASFWNHWTSTAYMPNTDKVWNVDFYFGQLEYQYKDHSNSYEVRCVRGRTVAEDLVDNNNGTVLDNNTGLIWQQGESNAKNWESSINYCESLTLSSKTDWRMPNYIELQSIVDYSRSEPAINKTYFPNTVLSKYWSSTNMDYDSTPTGDKWCVYFSDGKVFWYNKIETNYVRCVRGGQ